MGSVWSARFKKKWIVVLFVVFSSASVNAESLKISLSQDAFDALRQTPILSKVKAAINDASYAMEWVALPAAEVPTRAANGDFDGTFGSINVGSPALKTLTQVPHVVFRQGLHPVVLEGQSCPATLDELKTMKLQGVEHFDMFDAAEKRLRQPIPRLGTLPELLESLKSGDTEVTITFDYTVPGVEASFDIDLKLCSDVRIKSYQYYVYLHQRHADKIASVNAALQANLR